MAIPPANDLTQVAAPTKTARLPRYDATGRALPGSRQGRVAWLRGVADDKRIAVVHRLALIRLSLHRHDEGRCDAVAAEIGIDRASVLGALDAGIRRGWLADSPKAGGRVLLTFPARRNLHAVQGGQGVAVLPRRAP